MTTAYPQIVVNTGNPDPTGAINAFLWCMAKNRELGMTPPTEHSLAEHLFRKDAKIVFYSSMSGVLSIVMDEASLDDFDDEETFDLVVSVLKRRSERRKAKRAEEAASAIETQSATTAGRGPEDESAAPKADAQGDAARPEILAQPPTKEPTP